MKAVIQKSPLNGEIRIPGSKSHMIRALYFAALGDGVSTIREPVRSNDGLAAVGLCRALGVPIDMNADDRWIVTGGTIRGPEDIIDVGNSGTTMQLGAPIIASTGEGAVVTGDDQIRRRAILPVLNALRLLGVDAFTIRGNASAPFYLKGPIRGGKTFVDGIVSQYVSASILAGTLAEKDTEIVVDRANETPYIEMTLGWMRSCGIEVEAQSDFNRFFVKSGQTYRRFDRAVPADFSSAAFPLIGAAITDSEVVLHGLDTTDVQGDKILIDILREMGASIDVVENGAGGIRIHGGRSLRGTTIDCSTTPDSVPILSILGCCADGETLLTGIESSRLKETDRPLVMIEELTKMGADISLTDAGLRIRPSSLRGTDVRSHRDHRVAMALTIAGLVASGTTTVDQVESATISYPGFDRSFADLNASVRFAED